MDLLGNMDDRKITSGGAFILGGRLVSWVSKKQECISHSTTKEEYIPAANNHNEIMWLKKMLKDIWIEFTKPIIIYYDNTSIISMSKNPILHSKMKYISVKYHVLREKAIDKEIRLEYLSTKDQIVDIFTKPLPKDIFEYLRGMLGVMCLPTSK